MLITLGTITVVSIPNKISVRFFLNPNVYVVSWMFTYPFKHWFLLSPCPPCQIPSITLSRLSPQPALTATQHGMPTGAKVIEENWSKKSEYDKVHKEKYLCNQPLWWLISYFWLFSLFGFPFYKNLMEFPNDPYQFSFLPPCRWGQGLFCFYKRFFASPFAVFARTKNVLSGCIRLIFFFDCVKINFACAPANMANTRSINCIGLACAFIHQRLLSRPRQHPESTESPSRTVIPPLAREYLVVSSTASGGKGLFCFP